MRNETPPDDHAKAEIHTAPRLQRLPTAQVPSPGQQLLLGGGELVVAQRAAVCNCDSCWSWAVSLVPEAAGGGGARTAAEAVRAVVAGLRIGYTLPIGHILLLLRSRILLRISILLMVVDDPGGSDDDHGSYDGAH